MYKINMSFLCVLTALCTSQANANGYTYIAPTPTLGDNSLYTITEINKEEYDTLYGNSEVFYDAEVLEKDNIKYHYYKYAQKEGTTSSSSITSGNGGQDVEGGWYAKFGTFDGEALNLRSGSLGNVRGDFVNNAVDGSNGYAGAFYMEGTTIKSVTGDFVNNHIGGYFGNGGANVGNAYGGAMYIQNGAKITDGITGNFINNYVYGGRYVLGGAIFTEKNAYVSSINGKFINNHIVAKSSAIEPSGGAIKITDTTIYEINADFIHNYINSGSDAYGGALIVTSSNRNVPSIKGNFIDNYISVDTIGAGGAIFITRGPSESVIEGNFIGNYATTSTSSYMPVGGAVFARNNLTFKSDGETYFFSNNYTQNNTTKTYNSIFIDHSANTNMLLKFDISNDGSYVINDSIMGGKFSNRFGDIKNYRYKTLFNSDDGTGVVFLADNIINSDVTINNITLNLTNYTHNDDVVTYGGFGSDETSRSSVSLSNSTLNLHNNYYDKLNIKNYGSMNSVLHVNVGKENDTWVADNLNISGNIEGQTDVIVYALSKDDNTNADVMFVTAPNDTKKLSDAFNVSRVYGSPYMWTAVRNHKGETSGSNWYLVGNKESNKDLILPKAASAPEFVTPVVEPEAEPTPNVPNSTIAPEIVAGIGLQSASIEQTRNVAQNVSTKVANSRSYCPNCGIISDAWDGQQLRNAWIMAQGKNTNIDKNVDMDAKIWSIEAGFDLQNNLNNAFGVFASYRKGKYDLSGKASKYQSDIGSKIDMDSYLAGLYYRFDKNMNWAFASIHAGVLESAVKTDDRIAKFETDSLEFGASAEIGHTFALSKKTTLSPSVGVYYTQINHNETQDNVGKKYKLDDIKHIEAKLSLDLTKNFANAKIYIKPSVIQTLTEDDKVSVTGLEKTSAYQDQTLGKVEVGGSYGFTDNLSAYGWADYTFGSDYKATSLGFGLNYSW